MFEMAVQAARHRILNLHGDVYTANGFAYSEEVMYAISVSELSERSCWWLSRYAHVEAMLICEEDLRHEDIDALVNFSMDFDDLTFDDKIQVCNACAIAEQTEDPVLRHVLTNQILKWQAKFVRHLMKIKDKHKQLGPMEMTMLYDGPPSASMYKGDDDKDEDIENEDDDDKDEDIENEDDDDKDEDIENEDDNNAADDDDDDKDEDIENEESRHVDSLVPKAADMNDSTGYFCTII